MTQERKDIWIRALGILLIGAVLTYLMDGLNFSWQTAVTNLLYTTVYWEGCWRITGFYHKRFNTYQGTSQRILYQAIAITLYVVIMNAVVLGIIVTLIYPEYQFRMKLYWGNLTVSLMVTYLIGSIFEALNFFSLWKQSQIETAALKEERLKAQLETLKSQVNPHFLFNSLNTLSALIPDDPDKAVDFVQKLSQLYRYLLQFREQDTVELKTELDSISSYLYLQSMRFGDKLTWNIDVEPAKQHYHVPPLSLQLLAENAVKHNIISSGNPLHISIHNEGDQLVVRNNFQPKNSVEPSTRVGLNNLKERYRILEDAQIHVEQKDDNFTVTLPLLQP